MSAPASTDPACRAEEGCITCGDEAHPVRVLSADEATGLAVCAGEDGLLGEVEVGLVDPVAAGDVLLVHAGVALTRLDPRESMVA
ncbi:MAG: HypC/HybG/HupF family hydrogenase formation chaperone [Thermoleophilaceae bacterium]